jgi:fructose-1,6-bisphosphatase I
VLTSNQDNALGEFILTHPNMTIPKKRAIYSVNEGNSHYWNPKTIDYFNSLKVPSSSLDAEAAKKFKPYSSRYIGSMVADAYRTLLYGGIFAYPADKKSPKGKLRILYECAPMAMVMENAGGKAVNSNMERLLSVVPESIHDRSGIFMGSAEEMDKVIKAHQ